MYSPRSSEDEEVYSYGDYSSKEIESSKRSINNNDVPSEESSSSSEEGSSYRSSIGRGIEMLCRDVDDANTWGAGDVEVRAASSIEAGEAETMRGAEGVEAQ